MTSGDTVRGLMERTTAEALADPRLRSLLDGAMTRDDMQAFFRRFIVTHLNSVQILAFLTSIAPPQVMAAITENLLEEMGFEESEKSHPELVEDLARGLGYSEQDLIRIHAEADEARRAFISSPVPYPTMREFGLAVLLENVAFEYFLSRFSDGMAQALTTHYGLTTDAVMWFTLHGEVDIRHAEEGQEAILGYASHYRFAPEEFEQIARRTFAENVVLNRYFPPGSDAAPRQGARGIRAIDILPLRIPFRQAFTHSTMSRVESDAIVSLMDLAATFLDFGDIGVPPEMESRSLRPLLDSGGGQHREYARSALRTPQAHAGRFRMVQDHRYKLVEGFFDGRTLYDREADPLESVNIASDKPVEVERLAKLFPDA